MMAGRKLVIAAGHMMMYCRYLNGLNPMSLGQVICMALMADWPSQK